MSEGYDPKRVLKSLQAIPNVGPAFAKDLLLIGVYSLDQLKGQSPQQLFEKLEEITGQRQDPCVLDTFMAVVHFAETGESDPWWNFTPQRKAIQNKDSGKKRP